MGNYNQVCLCCGVDANRVLEGYAGNLSNVKHWLAGYFTSTCPITWVDPWVDVTPGAQSAWTDLDLTSYDAAADGAIIRARAAAGGYGYNEFRKNGSTDARETSSTPLNAAVHKHAFVGLDADNICELYDGSLANEKMYLLGYVKTGIVVPTVTTQAASSLGLD
jgi:hypothetical protein